MWAWNPAQLPLLATTTLITYVHYPPLLHVIVSLKLDSITPPIYKMPSITLSMLKLCLNPWADIKLGIYESFPLGVKVVNQHSS